MSETTLLFPAIVVATLAVAASAILSLARVAPPAGRRAGPVVPSTVLCPTTGDIARVEIGFDPAAGALGVLRCEQFPTGLFGCDRGCFPAFVLGPVPWPSPS